MRQQLKHIILLTWLLLFIVNSKAQVLSSEQLSKQFTQFIKSNPWEEVFLHVDRKMFVAGEDLWFFAYVIDRETGTTSGRSSVVYAELLDPMNLPVIQKRFKLTNGTGEGMFTLPDTLSSGTYTIRAYTNWMKNFLPGNCFSQELDVINPFKSSAFRKKISRPGTGDSQNMTFYPEGGTLVNGVRNRIAVRVQSLEKESRLFTVSDNTGEPVAVLEVDGNGYGSFQLTPSKGKSYTVKGNLRSFTLPAANDQGISVLAEHRKDGAVSLTLLTHGGNNPILNKEYSFLILSGARITYLADLYFDDPETVITIPPSKIPSGVSTLLILDKNGTPVCGRSVYTGSARRILSAVTGDTTTGRRSKVSLNINPFDDYSGKIKDLSISVTRSGLSGSLEGISDYLVFGTEFGQVPWRSSGFGLSEADPQLIDNFLISSYSRWIRWDLINSGKTPDYHYKFETGQHLFPVTVRYREGASSDSSQFLFMSMKGKVADFRYARGNSEGRYIFMLPADDILRNLVLQPEHATSDMVLEIEPSFPAVFHDAQSLSVELTDELLADFEKLSFNYQAARIYGISFSIPGTGTAGADLKKRRFYGIPELEIKLDDYIKLPVMQEVFFELVPGVVLRSRRGGYDMRIINPLTGQFYDEQPLVMIDGLIINDLSVIIDLDPELVERIEVIKTPYLIGDLILKGIVNIITRTGNFSGVTMPEFAAEIGYRVTEVLPHFQTTDYAGQEKASSRVPDLRNTLHWETFSDRSGPGKFESEFWTPDTPGSYIINIHGVTNNGDLFSLSRTVTVK